MDEELLEGDPTLSRARKAVPSALRAHFDANIGMPTALLSPSERNKLACNRHNVGEYRWAFVLHL
jgi:hypothetical protein